MQIGGFHHLAIQVRDLELAERFYVGLLGLPVIARYEDEAGAARSIWVGLGEGFLALERCGTAAPHLPFRNQDAGLHLLAMRIDPADRARWSERLEAAGHPVVAQTDYTIYVRDPEGNRIGLSHHPIARQAGTEQAPSTGA